MLPKLASRRLLSQRPSFPWNVLMFVWLDHDGVGLSDGETRDGEFHFLAPMYASLMGVAGGQFLQPVHFSVAEGPYHTTYYCSYLYVM